MDNIYQTIEIQFYRDLKKSENEFLRDKNAVEEIMKENSVEYVLEVVENQKKSAYEDIYIKGYTLNLIIRKIDLHYVLKLLDQNKIGFFCNAEDKYNAIKENEIYDEEENLENEIQENNTAEYEGSIGLTTEESNTFVRVFFSIFFSLIIFLDLYLIYWCYNIGNDKYLTMSIAFTILQLIFFRFFLNVFKNKKDKKNKIEYL